MTKTEFAEMVRYMREHQKERDELKTHESAMKATHCERAVDKALEQILADVPTDQPVLIESKP